MSNKFFDDMVFGRLTGLVSALLGVAVLAVNVYTLTNKEYYFPKLVFAGFFLVTFGIALVIFPGAKKSKKDYGVEKIGLRTMWDEAPHLHRAAWIVSSLIGMGIGGLVLNWLGR